MAAGVLDLYIEQGASFKRTLQIKDANNAPIDITNSTFRGQIRCKATDTTIVVAFTFTITDAVNGFVDMTLLATETELIPTKGYIFDATSSFVYDVEMETAGVVTRLLNGKVSVSPEVTK